MKILVINPGSTSTKVSLYEDDNELFTKSIFVDNDVLKKFDDINDQVPFRKEVIINTLNEYGYCIDQIDCFVGRGGSAYSQKEGIIEIDDALYNDTKDNVGGSSHPAKLGVMIAYELGKKFNKPIYTVNPTNVDELEDIARLTGIKGIYRNASCHVLNQKAVARYYADSIGKEYTELNLIVCHIDGGITVTAHKCGRMIDSNVGSGGDGPFTPTRVGSIPVAKTIEYLKEHSVKELEELLDKSGGFVSYFGTSNGDKIIEMIKNGNKEAKLVFDAMIYNIAKSIGSMAVVLKGNVDQIILTGGYIRYKELVEILKDYTGFIAPITCIKDREQETLAIEALKVLKGDIKANKYTKEPVNKVFFDRFK